MKIHRICPALSFIEIIDPAIRSADAPAFSALLHPRKEYTGGLPGSALPHVFLTLQDTLHSPRFRSHL